MGVPGWQGNSSCAHSQLPLLSILLSLVFLSVQIGSLQFGSLDLQALVLAYEFTSINCELYLILMLQGREERSKERAVLWKESSAGLSSRSARGVCGGASRPCDLRSMFVQISTSLTTQREREGWDPHCAAPLLFAPNTMSLPPHRLLLNGFFSFRLLCSVVVIL